MKLNNLQKYIYIYISLITSIFIVSFFWDKIIISFNNTTGANGFLVQKNYNPTNDTLRYIFFISLPLILFLYLNLILLKKKINLIELFYEKNKQAIKNDFIIKILFFIFFIFLILEFFSMGFLVMPFDHFHDGTFLAPAQNLISTEKLWTTSNINVENLRCKIYWCFKSSFHFLNLGIENNMHIIFLSNNKNTNFK